MDTEQPQQNNTQPNNEKPSRYLIFDTNTLSRASACRGGTSKSNDQVAKLIIDYLKSVFSISPGWGVAISNVTLFELIDESSVEEEIKIENALNGVQTFLIDEVVLRIAGRLGCFYKEIGISAGQISLADKIVGATAFITNSVIYTTNITDYPAPFFMEITGLRKTIEYENNKGYPVYLPTYFVTPQPEILNNYYEKRVKPVSQLPIPTNQIGNDQIISNPPVSDDIIPVVSTKRVSNRKNSHRTRNSRKKEVNRTNDKDKTKQK